MSEAKKIFISGPSDVNTICNELKLFLNSQGYNAIRMPLPEYSKSPVDVSIKELRRCDAMVLVLSKSIGDTSSNKIPITVWEYEEAMTIDMPVFVYVDKINNDKRTQELNVFIDRLRDEVTYNIEYEFSKDIKILTQQVHYAINNHRWIPKSFITFNGWKYGLLNTYFARMGRLVKKEIPERIGRRNESDRIIKWIKQSSNSLDILLVAGKTGYGKSLLAYHTLSDIVGANIRKEDKLLTQDDILLVIKESEISIEDMQGITPDCKDSHKPILIIVEDSGRQENNISKLVQSIKIRKDVNRFKLLFCVQEQYLNNIVPYCDPFLDRQNNIVNISSFSFSNADVRSDICKLLPQKIKFDDSHFHALEKETKGIPFFVDIVLRMINSGKKITEIDKNKIYAYILGSLDEKTKKNIILPIALLGPIKEDEIEPLITIIEKILNTRIGVDTFNADLKILVQKGIVGKYGRNYKIIPDILRNILILKLVNKDELKNTSLMLMKELSEHALERLINNIFRSLWNNDPLYEDNKDIIEEIIISLIDYLKSEDINKSYSILKIFADISYYIPMYAGDIARYIYEKYFDKSKNKLKLPENPDKLWGKTQYEIEIEKAAEIAYWVAISTGNIETRKLMFQILWDLGKDDKKETSSWPDHPLRRLEDLSGFKHYRFTEDNFKFYTLLLDCVKEWLIEYKTVSKPEKSPIKIFDKILDWEWENTSPLKSGIMLRRGHLIYDNRLEEIKIRAVEILINSLKNEVLLKHYDYFQQGLRHIRSVLPYYADKDRKNWKILSDKGLKELQHLAEYFINANKPAPAFRIIHEFRDYLNRVKEYSDLEDIKIITKEIENAFKGRYPEEYKILNTLIGEQFTDEPGKEEVEGLAKELLDREPKETFELLENIHNELESINWTIFNIYLANISFRNESQQEKWAELCLTLAELIYEKSDSHLLSGAGPHFLTNIRKYLVKNENNDIKQRYIDTLNNYKNKAINGSEPIKGFIQYELKRYFWFLLRDVSSINLYLEEKAMIENWEYEPDHTLIFILRELSKTEPVLAKNITLSIKIENSEKKASEKCAAIMHNEKVKESITKEDLRYLLDEMIDIPNISSHIGYDIQSLIVFFSNKDRDYADYAFSFFLKRIDKYKKEYEGKNKYDYKPIPPYISEHDYKNIFNKIDSEVRVNYLRKVRNIINMNIKPLGFANYDIELFKIVANNYLDEKINKEVVQILEEWLAADDKKLITLARIIEHSSNTFVFDYPELIIKIIRNAEKIEKSNIDIKDLNLKVQSYLAASVESGAYSRSIGQVSKKYIDMEQKANDIIREYKLNMTDPAYRFYYGIIKRANQEMEREKLSDIEEFEDE